MKAKPEILLWDAILDAVWAWEVARAVEHGEYRGGRVFEACMEFVEWKFNGILSRQVE